MTDTIKPRDAGEVEAAVRWAVGEQTALEIVGQGSKRALGRPARTDATLDLSALAGITLYEPQELVLSARAGTPIAEIEELVASHGQELSFEPVDLVALLGAAPGAGTLGGVVAAGLAGPRRIKAGGVRDHVLGFAAVSGRGELFKSGGRVVKNVTGYDLSKLMAGSFGTLAVLTDITVKTLPRTETEASVLVLGLDAECATAAMAAAMGSPCEVSGAAHVPDGIAPRVSDDLPVGHAVTALRLEGVMPSVVHRRAMLSDRLAAFGTVGTLNETQSRRFWRAVRDAAPFAAAVAAGDDAVRQAQQRPVWRLSTAPSQGAELARRIAAQTDAEFLFDWAGGLVWAALAPAGDAGAAVVRSAIRATGGHATLIRAPAAIRVVVDVFEPQPEALAALTRRVKNSFDPTGILNPGRMWVGI